MSLCKDGAFLMMGSENKKQNNLDIDTCTCKFTCIRGRNSLYNYIQLKNNCKYQKKNELAISPGYLQF